MRIRTQQTNFNRWSFTLVIFFLVAVFSLGGASRADAQSQVPLRLVTIFLCALALAWRDSALYMRASVPLVFLGIFAFQMVIQLLPLPPEIWRALPGREAFWHLNDLAGTTLQWRPISFQPDKTMNSLLALIPPAGAAIIFGSISSSKWKRVLELLIVAIAISALFGLMQITTGNSLLYLYNITNPGAPVGVFANRNHQGVLLATALPMLAMYASSSTRQGNDKVVWVAGGAALMFVSLILVTGSRAALAVAALGIGAGWVLHQSGNSKGLDIRPRKLTSGFVYIVILTAIAAVGVIFALFSRALSLQRIFTEDVSQEIRVKLFLPMLEIAWRYFPIGTGMGTFVDVFKVYEPSVNLDFTYLNHAHNELVELVIEGGLISIGLTSVFLWMWSRACIRIWLDRRHNNRVDLARLGSIVTGMIMIASLADYPLRTPIMSSLFVVMLLWMFAREPSANQQPLRN